MNTTIITSQMLLLIQSPPLKLFGGLSAGLRPPLGSGEPHDGVGQDEVDEG